MAKEIASFADGTPMNDKVNNSNDPLSFISVFHNTANVSAKNSFKYKNDVLAYCIEWETVVFGIHEAPMGVDAPASRRVDSFDHRRVDP